MGSIWLLRACRRYTALLPRRRELSRGLLVACEHIGTRAAREQHLDEGGVVELGRDVQRRVSLLARLVDVDADLRMRDERLRWQPRDRDA